MPVLCCHPTGCTSWNETKLKCKNRTAWLFPDMTLQDARSERPPSTAVYIRVLMSLLARHRTALWYYKRAGKKSALFQAARAVSSSALVKQSEFICISTPPHGALCTSKTADYWAGERATSFIIISDTCRHLLSPFLWRMYMTYA